MSNTWPSGYRHALSQKEHQQWNSTHYLGTRQCCDRCGQETERCEEDAIVSDLNGDILCSECYSKEESEE